VSRCSPYYAMIALAAVIAAPVLAQTMTLSQSAAPAPSVVLQPAPPSTTDTAGPAGHPATPEFLTADRHVRAGRLIGSAVYNDRKEKIGSVDELLLDEHHEVTSAILSVGGFLGTGSKLVKVPYGDLHVAGDAIVMPGATRNALTQMPTYEYAG
jgi:sporulation protein YlmC with PRC-barrel domain